MWRSSCALVLILLVYFNLNQTAVQCIPPRAKREVTMSHHASIASRFDGLECSKLLSYEQICTLNGTASLENVTIPMKRGKIIDSCRDIDRQDQYLMQLSEGSAPFPVVCVLDHQLTGDGWLVIQQRFDGSQDFYRNWVDYREGFGDLSREFWLGLEHLYRITSEAKHELLVEMVSFAEFGDRYYHAKYSSFEIGNEDEKYILKRLGHYSGTAGDSLRVHQGMRFSTYDNDNDRDPSSICAVKYYGGWWYDGCYAGGSNLNGKYKSNHLAETILWLTTPGKTRNFQYTRMMLRRTM